MICTTHQILFGWSNQEEWDRQRVWYAWGEERVVRGFGGETWKKENTWKT